MEAEDIPNSHLPSGFTSKILYAFLISPMVKISL